MSQMKAPRGTRDFGPDEMASRRHVEAQMRDVLHRFGFQEIQTPTFEHLDLFTAKSGEAIESELYSFEDKGGRKMALRPELTAPVMRFYNEALTVAPKPVKMYYFGNCFRYDRPQKGRYREFWQMGCELVGPGTPEAVGEVFAMGIQALRGVGLKDVKARIGHLGVLVGALALAGWPADRDRTALMRLIDKWDEDAVRGALTEAGLAAESVDWFVRLREASTIEALRAVVEAAPAHEPGELPAHVDALEAVIDAAIALGADENVITIDPLIARGLDYYTGVVFEMDAPALGAEKQLLGGGQYDLSGVFGGEPVPTCGFGLGFDRTLVALEAEGHQAVSAHHAQVYVAAIGDEPRPRAMAITHGLRAAGISVELDLMRRNPGKNLKAAANRNARLAILMGARELEAGTVSVKDLASGEQETVALDELTASVQARLTA